jgi:hypothetical protein
MLTGCACQVLVASVFSLSCAKSSDLRAPNLAGQHMCSTVPRASLSSFHNAIPVYSIVSML